MTRQLTAAALLALAACASASAQEAVQAFRDETLSTRTRAEVRAELDRARLAGELERRNHAYGGFERSFDMPGTLTRAEVLAEFERARQAHELDLRNYSVGSSAGTAAARRRADGPSVADQTTRRPAERPAS
jgi:hypothetical protein